MKWELDRDGAKEDMRFQSVPRRCMT